MFRPSRTYTGPLYAAAARIAPFVSTPSAGTIRKLYANSVGENSVHGSDSPENARIEVSYFFPEVEVHSYSWKDKR